MPDDRRNAPMRATWNGGIALVFYGRVEMVRQMAKRIARTIPRFRDIPILMPPAEFRALVNGGPISEEDHVEIGHTLFEMVRRECRLDPSSVVLDIGCGCGRIAQPMARNLTEGTYHGVDIVKPMTDWCSAAIASRHPNFHFHHADLSNTAYSARGRPADSYVFPFQDGTFDVIFATSVFTHLVAASAQQYLNEIARMLKPHAGRALLSFFLISKNRPRRTMGGKVYQCDGYKITDKGNPESIVIFEEADARKMLAMAGLEVENINLAPPSDDPENWLGQDIFVVSR
jgi:SAM-dependent methyltransferase